MHAHPSFSVRVAAKYSGGAVVENATNSGEFFNLFPGSLARKGRADEAKAAFALLKVGDLLDVTCQDPAQHTPHKGPDGAMRPNVSVWLVQVMKNTDNAKEKVALADAWQQRGGGYATVWQVRDAFLLCEVTVRKNSFIGLWHKTNMPEDFDFQDLQEGEKIPHKLNILEARPEGSRAVIRFKVAS